MTQRVLPFRRWLHRESGPPVLAAPQPAPAEPPKPHECKLCGKGFRTPQVLQAHEPSASHRLA
eukprot:968591-Alexandrium_andersonii.AAC.1